MFDTLNKDGSPVYPQTIHMNSEFDSKYKLLRRQIEKFTLEYYVKIH